MVQGIGVVQGEFHLVDDKSPKQKYRLSFHGASVGLGVALANVEINTPNLRLWGGRVLRDRPSPMTLDKFNGRGLVISAVAGAVPPGLTSGGVSLVFFGVKTPFLLDAILAGAEAFANMGGRNVLVVPEVGAAFLAITVKWRYA